MNEKLRLVVTRKCPRSCEGCCMKDYNPKKIKFNDINKYKEIYITGGEPLLYPELLTDFLRKIKKPDNKVILYTALSTPMTIIPMLNKGLLDGITLTLHEKKDIRSFTILNHYFLNELPLWDPTFDRTGIAPPNDIRSKSLRLNVFKEVGFIEAKQDLRLWKVKNNIEWIKNCPLPEGEDLRIYDIVKESVRGAEYQLQETPLFWIEK